MPAKDYASTRYSELDEIDKQNVKDLKVAFTFSPGVARGQESVPIVVGTTMYKSGMPNLGLGEAEARDVAAYLFMID